jgi:hypothetical protein
MAKMLVNVRIGDDNNKDFKKLVQVELNSIDCLVIKDCMEFCDGDEYDTSWNNLVRAIERQSQCYLPREWYIDKIESYEYPN